MQNNEKLIAVILSLAVALVYNQQL